jgi:cyanuric acid amidohydrolase
MNLQTDVHRFPLADPGDVQGLRQAIATGLVDPREIVAVIGKTHGNGLVNDYTRGFLTQSLAFLISGATGETPEAIRQRIPFVFSGGVEGVLSPHYSVFTVTETQTSESGEKALAIGVAFTPELAPGDVGRQRQIDLTADAVIRAMRSANIQSSSDVHFVQIKGPAFAMAEILADADAGGRPASDNPGKLMGLGRAASALGVAKALGEIPASRAVESAIGRDFEAFSSVASCSAGVEVRANEVIVVGMSSQWSGPLAIEHAPMKDALDTTGIRGALSGLGFPDVLQLSSKQASRIRAVFVKCEASRDGVIRGKSHMMLNDGDIDQQRHIRAAVGAIAASVVNDTAIFVSGGAEHQGPDGGGMIAIIAECA